MANESSTPHQRDFFPRFTPAKKRDIAREASTSHHRESFERFMFVRLPQLLEERLPVVGSGGEETGDYTFLVRVRLKTPGGEVENTYEDLPWPDADGVFKVDGQERIVVPIATSDDLETATIRCVGEQLYDFVEARLKSNAEDLPDDAEIARAWLPLETWMGEFLAQHAEALQNTNWLARHTHLRRVYVAERSDWSLLNHLGRVCPLETPEGPNIGRHVTLARGAEIREGRIYITVMPGMELVDGRVVIVEEHPEARLGLAAAAIPFLENSEPRRSILGANLMRQWLPPGAPEPALVQSGHEPDAPEFWCGRNLLTAYISWGGDTIDDGIVISESCAQVFGFAQPLEPGDKLSNRHGAIGVVARILPDREMPRLQDGTPVDLIYGFLGILPRLNFGQLREAAMGRIARAAGEPATVPPFQAPGEQEMRQRLVAAGLPEDGMERLVANGRDLEQRSAVGWVYWGCTNHLARHKIHAATDGRRCQRQTDSEYFVLRRVRAYETIRAHYNTQAVAREDAADLAARCSSGAVQQAGPPAPNFVALQQRLSVAGIRMLLEGETLLFGFAQPQGESLRLACPLPHPWLSSRQVEEVGACAEVAEYGELVAANQRLKRILDSRAPARLQDKARADLKAALKVFVDALLTPQDLRFNVQVNFSGRTVLAPGPELRLDQLGVPEEIAWTLYGPLVERALGKEEVLARSPEANKRLDAIMAREWILLFRAPAFESTAFLAFHGVRIAERVLRINPLACTLLNGDFDGDQAAVILPLTQEGQYEAGELLSIAGHCKSDPSLLEKMWWNRMDAVWGLAHLGRTAAGREEIDKLIGGAISPAGKIIAQADLAAALVAVMAEEGVEAALRACERLLQRGCAVARTSGASISPFPGAGLERPPLPLEEEEEVWDIYAEEVAARLAAYDQFGDDDIGPVCLGIHSGARATWQQFAATVGVLRAATGGSGRHGLSQGLTPEEVWAFAGDTWRMWNGMHEQATRAGREIRVGEMARGVSVLARARRAQHPGVVFARAAASAERELLVEEFSRLFVGLPV